MHCSMTVRRCILALTISVVVAVDISGVQNLQPRFTNAQLTRRMTERRAVDAAIWGMPLVNMDALRQAYFRDAQANYNDIVFWSRPSDWKNQILTPNQSNYYVYFNFNTKNGPVIVEIPPIVEAGLTGTFIDAWNVPLTDIGAQGEDQGKGGRYVLLPPDFGRELPQGVIRVPSRTVNGYALFRATPTTSSAADVAKAIALIKRIRVYPFDQAGKPAEQRFVDMVGRLFDGIPRLDESFYSSLARMVNEEPAQPRDAPIMGMLRPIGIEKGRPFAPDAATRTALQEGIREARAWLLDQLPRWGIRWWDDRRWDIPASPRSESALTYEEREALDIDARGILFFTISGIPKKAGAAFYLWTFFDARGQPLRGDRAYRLRVPANVPMREFWAITVYDRETNGLIRGMSRGTVDSFDDKVSKNADGSVDVFFGPRPPAGEEANWIPTVRGRDWFPIFRIYGPEAVLFEKTWKLPDIQAVG